MIIIAISVLNIAFLNWILESFIFHYSLKICDLFGSIWLLMIFFVFAFSIFIYFTRKYIRRKSFYLASNMFFILFIIFLFVIPFFKGKEFRSLEAVGLSIANSIEKYERENSRVPKSLSVFYGKEIMNDEIPQIEDNFKYSIDSNSSGLSFKLEMRPLFVKHSTFYYDKRNHKFVEMD